MVAGIGIAAAGGVAGYSSLGKQSASVQQQKCCDEPVATVTDPKDPHQIAGTAVGAVVGGAVGEGIGDRGITMPWVTYQRGERRGQDRHGESHRQ